MENHHAIHGKIQYKLSFSIAMLVITRGQIHHTSHYIQLNSTFSKYNPESNKSSRITRIIRPFSHHFPHGFLPWLSSALQESLQQPSTLISTQLPSTRSGDRSSLDARWCVFFRERKLGKTLGACTTNYLGVETTNQI